MRLSPPACTKRLGAGVHHATSRSGASASSMRGSRAEPERHRDLAVGARLGREALVHRHVEAGGGDPSASPSPAAKPRRRWACSSRRNSRSCGAKSTTSSRPAGAQHARRFADRARAVVEEVQHLMDDDDVERVRRHREIVDVALPHAAMAQARRARAARARASSMSSDRSRPSPRSIAGRTVRACGRCRCRDRAASGTAGRRAPSRIAASTASSATCSLRMRSHSRGVRAEIILRRGGARRAHRGEPLAVARDDRSRRDRAARPASRASSALPPRSASRKNAQEPSRKRSTRPASASSLRWREMRGCDWRRMSVRSETVSSASASSASDAQPRLLAGGLERGVEGVERQVGSSCGHVAMSHAIHHIKISLYR